MIDNKLNRKGKLLLSTISNGDIYNKIGFCVIGLLVVLFYLLNHFTPLIADDFSYSLGITSVKDIILLEYNQYFSWSGRSVAHFMARFWLLIGKPVFNVMNTIVYCIFVIILQFHITGNLKKFDPWFFCLINIFLWFFVPAWGQNFLWLTGSCNYLWTTTILLLFLIPYRKRIIANEYKLNIPISILFFILGILAGWSNENSGAAVLFFLIALFCFKMINKNRLALFEIIGLIGFIVGFLLLIIAPGNYARMNVIYQMNQQGERTLTYFVSKFISITHIFINNNGFILFWIAAFLSFDLIYNQKKKISTSIYFYAVAVLAGTYSMILAPFFPDRSFLIVTVFLCITLGTVILQYKPRLPQIFIRNKVIIIILLFFALSYSYLLAARNTMGIYLKWQERIEYIITEKEKGNLDIEVKAPIPATDRHTALYGLSDIFDNEKDWPNNDIARYFGINSIKGRSDNVPWNISWRRLFSN